MLCDIMDDVLGLSYLCVFHSHSQLFDVSSATKNYRTTECWLFPCPLPALNSAKHSNFTALNEQIKTMKTFQLLAIAGCVPVLAGAFSVLPTAKSTAHKL
jgi:hypothetical protein